MFMLMTAGMATVAGTVLILYATFVGQVIDNAIGHLLTASIISAPAAITVAQLPARIELGSGRLAEVPCFPRGDGELSDRPQKRDLSGDPTVNGMVFRHVPKPNEQRQNQHCQRPSGKG